MALKIGILFLVTVLAFWMSAISGGGAGLVLIPLLHWLLPSAVVPFALTVGTFTSSATRIAVFKKNIRWSIVRWFVPFALPAVLLGAWLIKYLNPLYLQVLVGIFLIVHVTHLFKTKEQQHRDEKPYSRLVLAIVGFLAGFVSGITGAIGLLFNRFYLRYGLTNEEIVATRAANDIVLHAIKLCIYLLLGLYSNDALVLGAIIAFGSIFSVFTVKWLLPFISPFLFRKIGYAAMVGSGLFLLVETTRTIIQEDRISFATNAMNERTINWRESSFVLEFAFDDGLEIERPIHSYELPYHLQVKYIQLLKQYDQIALEKVFKMGASPSYEFYCYKERTLVKLAFEEE